MKFYLKAPWQEKYTEVTKEQFIMAERNCGFRSKFGEKSLATAGFSSNGLEGKVIYEEEDVSENSEKVTNKSR